jgi:hypothetical protein
MYATSVYNRLPRRTEPVAIIEASKEPVMKIPRRRTLAAVATKLYLYDKAGYELLKDRRSDPAILVTSLLDSPFKVILAKHRGYDQQLLLTMTIEFVRQEGKRTQYVAQPKKATEEREPKKPLTRRQQAAALKRRPRPPHPRRQRSPRQKVRHERSRVAAYARTARKRRTLWTPYSRSMRASKSSSSMPVAQVS